MENEKQKQQMDETEEQFSNDDIEWVVEPICKIYTDIRELDRKSLKQDKMVETEELGSKATELLRPENLMGSFNSVEELMKNTWDAED